MRASRRKVLAVMASAEKRDVKFHCYVADGKPGMCVSGFAIPARLKRAIKAYWEEIAAAAWQKKCENLEYAQAVKNVGRIGATEIEVANLDLLEIKSELHEVAKQHLVSAVKVAGGSVSTVKQPDGSLNLLIVGELDDRLFKICERYHAEIATLIHAEQGGVDTVGIQKG